MKSHHGVGHFKARLMIATLSLIALTVSAAQSFAATTCSTCHGMPPVDSTDGSRNTATGAFRGNHQIHMGATASAAECSKCHGNSGYNNDHSSLSNNKINMNSNINTSSLTATYSKSAPFDQSATPTLGTCSNVNCHFEKITPTWGVLTPTTNCNTCHDTPRANTGANGSHAVHEAAYGGTASCATCHPNYGTTNFNHATSAGKHKIVVNPIMNYAGGTPVSWLPSQSKAFGSCNNVSCHSNGKGVYANPTWGTTNSVGCAFCHPNLGGKHSAHVKTAQLATAAYSDTSNKSAGTVYDFGCANCHPTALSNHINGTVDITLNSTHGGPLKSKNNIAVDNAGYTQNLGVSVTCAASYCHSNGMATPTFYGASVDWYEASYVGDKCARCHGNSPNSGGKTGSAAHAAHVVGIHYDDIFNGVSKKLPISGASTVNAAHGKDSRSTTINCNICHAATVTSSANDSNTACSGCHNGTTAPLKNSGSLIADASKHVNGTVEVAFINQKIATKAQLVDTAFRGYTASASGWARRSNSMKFKTYTSSYDYTKSTLASATVATPYTTATGCLNIACHASIPVKWTDSVTCVSCHTRLK